VVSQILRTGRRGAIPIVVHDALEVALPTLDALEHGQPANVSAA